MSCCQNAILTRYRIRFEDECVPAGMVEVSNPLKIWQAFTKVGNLALGDEGSVEVPEWDRKVKVADGIRVVNEVPMAFRVNSIAPGSEFAYIMEWTDKRAEICRTLYVDVCDRAWTPLWIWKFVGCQMMGLPKEEDKELGANKIAIWNFSLTPYDVSLLAGDGATVLVKPTKP